MEKKTASAGWYNSAAFEEARAQGRPLRKSFNGDAFSNEMKQKVIEAIKTDLGQIDMIVYSRSPRRTDPVTGEVFKSVLKPTGETFTNKNLNTDKKEIETVSIDPRLRGGDRPHCEGDGW